jgi:poly(beta-D-mannuronate) lyase
VDVTAPAVACAPAPSLPEVLVFNGYYVDAHHSVIDSPAKAAYEASSRANEVFVTRIGRAADGYQAQHSESAADCAFTLLQQAAQDGAFSVAHLGKNGARDGFYVQGFYLDGLALAYLKVRPSSAGSSQQRAEIQAWLLQIALSVEQFYDDMARENAGDGHNNLTYWGALGVSATGIATERSDLFDWGTGVYRQALRQIAKDGTLPLELDRASMALHYHLFAVAPLVMIAELGERNGLHLYDEDNGALHRLVKRTIGGLVDPAYFAEKTHIAQEMPSELDGSVLGWSVPYEDRYPDPVLASLLAKASSTSNWQLGGRPPNSKKVDWP